MEKIDATVLFYALLAVLLLQFSSPIGAVDIVFFQDPNGCDSGAIGCYNVGPNICCESSASQGGSVLVTNAGSDVLSQVYRDGGCTTYVGTGPGRGDICYVGGQFTGAFWYFGRRRSLLAGSGTKCDSQMKPNSVFFTEDSTKGHWVLTSSDADRLYLEMQTVLDVEKLNWLKSLGAIYNEF
jgi:hypothetical protein